MALGFYQSQYNSALFLNKKGTYVAIYIDNFQIIGPDLTIIKNLKTSLFQKFKMIYLSPISYYISMEVNIFVGKVIITQNTYVKKLLDLHQMNNCNSLLTPILQRLNLEPEKPDFTPDAADIIAYKKFTEFLQWLAYQT